MAITTIFGNVPIYFIFWFLYLRYEEKASQVGFKESLFQIISRSKHQFEIKEEQVKKDS